MEISRPILQLHLSRHCNLACRHCYSASGPREKRRLALTSGFFEEAYRSGVRIISFSGGEPLLDPTLRVQVTLARDAGLGVNLVSNGMLVSDEWAAWLAEHIDLIAISIDGPPALHDSIRLRDGAFDAAMLGVRRLRDIDARVAVIHTATMDSLPHLTWLVDTLREEGIRLLQLHPLEETGRAETEFDGKARSDLASRVAYLAQLLSPETGLAIHVDAISRPALADLLATLVERSSSIVDFLSPLVVEPDGTIVPWTFGISRALALGNVLDGRLSTLLTNYEGDRLAAAVAFQKRVAMRLLEQSSWPYMNWYGELSRKQQLLPVA